MGNTNLVASGAYVVAEPEGGTGCHLDRDGFRGVHCARGGEIARGGQRPRRGGLGTVSSICFASNRANIARRFSSMPPRIGIEAAVEGDWARWLGDSGEFIGMTGFGASAPAERLYREFGITAQAVATAAQRCIARSRDGEN